MVPSSGFVVYCVSAPPDIGVGALLKVGFLLRTGLRARLRRCRGCSLLLLHYSRYRKALELRVERYKSL